MALFKRKHEDFCLLLISLLSVLPLTATLYNDCNGKSFHCVNSTHFMICVDVGGGVSMTVDNFVIQCPPTTFCQSTNNFECEYKESTALNEAIKKSEITNDPTFLNVISLDQVSTQNPMFLEDGITSVLPLEKSISSKPSQISDTNVKKARPNAVSNTIKKDATMPKIIQNDIPEIDRQNGLELDGNNSQPSFTESTTEIDQLQNNISLPIDTNFTFIPSAINSEEIITNIPSITENALEIENKELTSRGSLITKDMFSKILNTSSKFKPEVGVDSNNGEYISAVDKTNGAVINENEKVAKEQNLDTTSFFLNGTLTNTLSNHSELETNQSHNVSLNVNVLTDTVINNGDLSALSELKSPNNIVTSQNKKPVLMPLERPTIASNNNYRREMQVETITTNNESNIFLNGASNMKINTSETAIDQYPEYDKPLMNNTVPKKSTNYTQSVKITSQSNIDPTANREIKNFGNNEDLIIPIEIRNSSALSIASENIKSDIVPPKTLKTLSNYNSSIESQLTQITNESKNIDFLVIGSNGKIHQSTSKTEEDYPKNDNLFPNTTVSNDLVNNVSLENIQNQNTDLSVNGEINNLRNTELPTIPIDLRNSSARLNSAENIKSETMSPDKSKIVSYNNSDGELQIQNKTYNNESVYSSNNNLNTKNYVNTNTIKYQYPKIDNLLNNTTISNELANNTKLENIKSQSTHLSVNGEIDNFGNSESRIVPMEFQNLSAQSTAPENIKSEDTFPDKPTTISYDNTNIEMKIENETNINENVYSFKTSNVSVDANAYTTEKQYTKFENVFNNTTVTNELVHNTKLENKYSQNIDLNVKRAIYNIENTEDPNIIELRNTSAQPTASKNIKSKILSSDNSKTLSKNNSNIERQTENETNNNENIYSTNNTLNAKADANTNTTVEQNHKNDNLLSNATISNKAVNNTNLENTQSQNIDLRVNKAIDNFTNADDPPLIGIRNSFAQLTASQNMKSKITPSDKPKATSNNDSNIEMQPKSKANVNVNLHSSNISSNATIDANTNTTEEKYPKTDILLNNTAITNQLVNNMKMENILSQNITPNVKEALNDFGYTEDSTIIELKNTSAQSFASENIQSEIMPTDKPKATSNNDSNIEMQPESKANDNGNLHSSNISPNATIVNTNTTDEQYPKTDNFFNNTAITNQLVNNMKVENISSQNINLNVKEAVNNFGNTKDLSTIETQNSSVQSFAPKNVKSEIMSSEKLKTISDNNSDIDMQMENKTNDNEKVNSLNVTLNVKIDANSYTPENQYSVQITSPENIVSLKTTLDKHKATKNNNSIDNNDNGYLHYSNITSNVKIDTSINTTEKQYPQNNDIFFYKPVLNELLNNSKMENIQNQNIDIMVNGRTYNFGNTQHLPIPVELQNLSAHTTTPENIKSETISPENPNFISYHNSDIEIQMENVTNNNENVISLKSPKKNLLFNINISNEFVNNTKLKNIQSQNMIRSVKGEVNNFKNAENSSIIESWNTFGQSATSENIKFEITHQDKAKVTRNNDSNIEIQTDNKTNDNWNSLNISSSVKIGANINTKEEQYPKNGNLLKNTIISNKLVNDIKLKDIQRHIMDLSLNGGINNFTNTEHPNIIELRNLSGQSSASENNITKIFAPDKPNSYHNSDVQVPMQNETNNNENVYSLNSSHANIDPNTITTEEKYSKNKSLFNNTTISNELVNNMKLGNIQSQNTDLNVKRAIDSFGNTKDKNIIELRNIPAQSTASQDINSEIMLPDKPKASSNNGFNIEMQIESRTNSRNVHLSYISANNIIDENINTTEKQYRKNDNLFINISLSNDLLNSTKLENMQLRNKNLTVNGPINSLGTYDNPAIPIELKNYSVQLTGYSNVKPKIMPLPKIANNNSSSIEMQTEKETNNTIYNLNVTSSDKIDTTEQYSENDKSFDNAAFTYSEIEMQVNNEANYSKKNSSFDFNTKDNNDTNITTINVHPVLIQELSNGTDLKNIKIQNKNQSTNGEIENFIDKKGSTVSTNLSTLYSQFNKSKNTKTEFNSLDIPKINSNNNSVVDIENREEWDSGTENGIFKGTTTYAIQPTLNSATSIDDSLTIIINMNENAKTAELQPNSEYYSVLTVTEKITQSTSAKPNFVDQYAIMNNGTIINNTSNDENLIDSVEIFNRSFDATPVNGTQPVPNVAIPNIRDQENIIYTHEYYRVENDQNDAISKTNEKSMILFNNATKTDENSSGILNISNITVIENSTQSTLLDNSRKNINNRTNIPTITENFSKASPRTLTLLHNSEVIVNETVVNSNLAQNYIKNKVLTSNKNAIQTISGERGILIIKGNITTNYLSNINEAAETGRNTRMDELSNNVLTDMVNSTETTADVLLTTDESLLSTYMSHNIINSDKDENVYRSDIEVSTQTILVNFQPSTKMFNFTEVSETSKPSLRNVNQSLDRILFGALKYQTQKNYKEGPNSQAINESHVDNLKYVKFSDIPPSVETDIPHLPVTNTTNNKYKQNYETSLNASNFQEILNIKTLNTSGTQNPTDKLELHPLIQQNNNYDSGLFPYIVYKNGTLIDIKSLLHSSEKTNLTKANSPLESDVNTKILHYNGTKIATSYNKDLGAKHVKVENTTDILRPIEKVITKFSTQSYAVSHRDTNMMKFSAGKSEKNINASYSVKSLNLTNITTEINSNKINENNTTKYDEVRNTTLPITTTKTSSAFKNNESKIFETVTKSSILGNTRIKSVLPKFFCRNNSRGRFADENNCRRFYICIGNLIPVLGLCPENTVFSEFRKQCAKNFSHCIRHNQFKCSKEGRFSDVGHENIYYICIKDAHQRFVSFKFQCQNGYRLDKTNVTCNKVITILKSSSSSSSTSSKDDDIKATEKVINKNLEQHKPSKSKSFKCESKGKFPDPTNCRRYYVCSNTSKSKLRRKRKKCDSDEIFDSDENKCVDKDSHECK